MSSAAEALRGMATQTEEAMAGFVDGALEAPAVAAFGATWGRVPWRGVRKWVDAELGAQARTEWALE